MLIGVDFDNTIVNYDCVFHKAAQERRLISRSVPPEKKAVRDSIRRDHDDIAWQRLQSEVYANRMHDAEVMPGVRECWEALCEAGHALCIVSHKTVHAHFDDNKTDLRELARQWLKSAGLVGGVRCAVRESDVFFESTREEKVRRIASLGCGAFVDDLLEVFLEPNFPEGVRKILFGPGEESRSVGVSGVQVCRGWTDVQRALA